MVDSAGVSARVGARPHLHSVRVAASRGIELSGKSRQIVRADLYRFHHIIVLDREVHRQLMQLIGPVTRRGPRVEPVHDPRGEIRLFATLANPAARGRGLDITDPVREPEATFESTCVALLAGCEALLNELAP
jgi:protein-tyrosine-phosphatase